MREALTHKSSTQTNLRGPIGGGIFTLYVKSSRKIIANLIRFPANESKSWV